jgi:AcrR family transcriptional regulator
MGGGIGDMRKHGAVTANSRQEDPMPMRARKKQRTREQIASAAVRLFAAKGFDGVTIAEVARAADVSEQTVYNYFPTKEQLVLDEDAAFEARLVAMVRDRRPGTSLVDAVRSEAHKYLDELGRRPTGPERAGGMPHLIAVSPTLRRYWLEMVERHANAVARMLVSQSESALALPAAKIIALSLTGVFAVIIDELGQSLKAGSDRKAVLQALRAQTDVALDRLRISERQPQRTR